MENAFIGLGLFLWFLTVLMNYVFLTNPKDGFFERMKQSLRIRLRKSEGSEFGTSILKITGIIWIIFGFSMKIFGGHLLQGFSGDIIIAIVILTPVMIGAIIAKRKNIKNF